MKMQKMRILKNVYSLKEKKIIQAFENPCLYLAWQALSVPSNRILRYTCSPKSQEAETVKASDS